MGNYSAPGIGRDSKIYHMAKNRNYKVLFTSLVILIFGILALYDVVMRPGAQTPAGILLDFIIIGISLYGFYLFLTRSLDIFRYPDVKKFLSFDDPRHYLDLFEQESADERRKKFRDGFITSSFIVTETFYRFRWAHAKEITAAYIGRALVRYRGIPIPFIGVNTVVVHFDNGTAMHINCDTIREAESLLKILARIAPSARYGSAIFEKPGMSPDYEAIAQDVANTIKQIPGHKQIDSPKNEPKVAGKAYVPDMKISAPYTGLKSNTAAEKNLKGLSPVTPGTAPKAEQARVRQLSKDEICDRQIKDLYDSLGKENIAQSVYIIDTLGDSMNFASADIVEILLEYPDEPVRVHAVLALGKFGQKSSVEPLIKALDDPSVQVRENAAIALGKIGDQRAVAPLQQVSREDVRTKKAAVGALARIDKKLGIYNRQGGSQNSFFHTTREKYP